MEGHEPFDRKQVDTWMRAMPPSFVDWLKEQQRFDVERLMNATDLLFVGRYQGRLAIWEQFVKFREGT